MEYLVRRGLEYLVRGVGVPRERGVGVPCERGVGVPGKSLRASMTRSGTKTKKVNEL